ncbi:MAG: hypothetical protein ACM3WV_05435 [Bacillota bacterium]
MAGISWQEREPYTQSMNLIVSLLMRYPQIATVSLHPEEHSLHFVFIINARLTQRGAQELEHQLKEGWESFWQLTHARPELTEINFTGENSLTLLEVKRDVASITLSEISYLIQFLQDHYQSKLCQEQPSAEGGGSEESWPEELIELLLDDLREIKSDRNLIGFREEGRVFVYRT